MPFHPFPSLTTPGLQGAYLLAAIDKYHSETLDDWISYLTQSWAGALYLDNFLDFALGLRALLETDEGENCYDGGCSSNNNNIIIMMIRVLA